MKSGLTIRQCDLAGISVSRTLNRVTIAVWTDASTANSAVALCFYFQVSETLYRNYRQEIVRQKMGYQYNVTVEIVIHCRSIFVIAKLHIFRLNGIKILILNIL